MAVFRDQDHLYECIGGLFDELGRDPNVGKKLKDSNLVIRFSYTEPDCAITVDCKSPPTKPGTFVNWVKGDGGLTPEVEMSMKADVAHRFWLGKVVLLTAITRRQIVAKGPIPKVLKLLPIIKPAYAMYAQLLEKKGYRDMLVE